MKRISQLITLLFVIGMMPLAAHAAGKLVGVLGVVEIDRSPAVTGSAFGMASQVITGEDSLAVLQFSDNQMVALGPNSHLIIRIDSYDANSQRGRSIMELTRGAIRYQPGARGKSNPRNIKITTGSATIVAGSANFLAGSTTELNVIITDGTLAISNASGNNLFSAGQTVNVASAWSSPRVTGRAHIPDDIEPILLDLKDVDFDAYLGGAKKKETEVNLPGFQ